MFSVNRKIKALKKKLRRLRRMKKKMGNKILADDIQISTMAKTYTFDPNPKKWNVKHAGSGFDNINEDHGATKVTLKKGKFAASGGSNLKVEVPDIFPSKHVELRYKCYVPDDFDSVKGGKLFGITINSGCGGRDWQKDKGSVRIMFRRDNQLVIYLYLPTNQGKYTGDDNCPLMKNQGKAFREVCHHTNGAGLDMFRNLPKKEQLRFENGKWNDIELEMKMNEQDKSNGVLRIKVNDNEKVLNDVCFSADPKDTPFKFLQASTWFGGGDESYAPKKDTYISYKDITLVKKD